VKGQCWAGSVEVVVSIDHERSTTSGDAFVYIAMMLHGAKH
jgi:hypothetical protein